MLHELRADDARTLSEQRAIAQMPAPPFQERVRAEYCQKRFAELGLKETAIDAAGNVTDRPELPRRTHRSLRPLDEA
jgi:tripeptide aminopeptidase